MNDTNFITGLKDMLKEAANDCAGSAAEYIRIDEEIKSGKYSADYVNSDLIGQRADAKSRAKSIMNSAKNRAYEFIDDYAAEIRNLDRLDSSQLTDDVKLLNCGVALKKADLIGLLDKNKDNNTMTQIILRYADEHNIDIGRPAVYVSENQTHADNVDKYKTIVDYYMKYIDQPNALDMLDKFIET